MRLKILSGSRPLREGICTAASALPLLAARGTAAAPATAPELFRRSRRDHFPNRPMPRAPSDISDDVDFDQRIAWNAGSRCRGAHRRRVAPVVGAIDRVHAVIILEVGEEDADLQTFLQRGPRVFEVLLDL